MLNDELLWFFFLSNFHFCCILTIHDTHVTYCSVITINLKKVILFRTNSCTMIFNQTTFYFFSCHIVSWNIIIINILITQMYMYTCPFKRRKKFCLFLDQISRFFFYFLLIVWHEIEKKWTSRRGFFYWTKEVSSE